MGKLFATVAAILLFVGIYTAKVYMQSNTQTSKEMAVEGDESSSFELGQRFPAGKKIDYKQVGLKEKKSSEIKNLSAHSIHQQEKTKKRKTKSVSVKENSEASNLVERLVPKKRAKLTDYEIPSEVQNFLNPSFNNSTGSASSVTSASGVLITGAHSLGNNSQSNSSTSDSSSTNSGGGPSGVAIEEELKIRGTVLPLVPVITNSPNKFLNEFYAYANPVCSNPKVGIYLTEDILKLGSSPLFEQELKAGAAFNFNLTNKVDKTKPQKYSLQVSGCDTYYSRIITDFSELQDIHLVSTLISFSQVSQVNIAPSDTSKNEFKDLVKKLEESGKNLNSYEDIFAELSSPSISSSFNTAFHGSIPDTLKNSLPVLGSVTLPNSFDEEVDYNLVANASHWSVDYDLAVEWFINNVSTGYGNNWIYRAPGNSPATVAIKVRIGKKHATLNEVDLTLPYHELNFSRGINNTVSPTPPDWILDTTIADVTNSPNLNLELNTGASLENCSSFTALAITEVPISPDLSEFNIICTDAGVQVLNYALNAGNRADGNKSLYLWARDGYGDISSTPKIIHFYLDQSAPVMTITALNALYGGGQSVLLNWKMSDHTVSNALSFDIEFYDGSSWYSLPDVAMLNGPLVDQNFSTSYTLPDSSHSGAKFRVTASDQFGHTSSIESTLFNIQTALITSSPVTHNFGDIAAGSNSSSQVITFTNTSSWPSGICSSPSLSGHAAQFTILSENCSGVGIAGLGSCQVTVRANPSLRQPYSADVNLVCGGSQSLATVMVTGDNNPPTLGAVAAQNFNEDTIHNFTLTSGADLDSDPLTYYIVSSPSHGVLSNCLGGTADLTCSFTPDLNYNGADSFSYRTYDGFNYSAPVTVSLSIAPINDAPTVAATQSVTADEETIVSFSLNAGSDIENDTLSYIVVSSTTNGVLNCTGGLSRSCTYQGNLNFNGTDSFTYKVNDGLLDSNIATVTITVNPVNDEPISPVDYLISVDEDSFLDFTLTAGTDIDLPAETLTYVLVTAPANGTITGCIESGATTDRTCRYTPNPNYNGADSFVYRVCDPHICSTNSTTVSITVNQVNDAPVMIADQAYSLDDNQVINFALNGATDIDLPAQTLSYRLTAAVSQGTLTGCIDESLWNSDTSCTYTPPANFNGDVTITYKAYDGIDESVGTSSITFTISDKTPSPTPVIALHSPYVTNQSSAQLTNFLCTDIDGLFISLTNTKPAATDAGWVACTTVAGALTSSLTTFNGIQKIYAWSKDQYGNVSNETSVDVVYDSIAPVLSILTTNNVAGNQTITMNFTSTELHATVGENFEIRYHNGTSWSDWTVASANGPHAAQLFSTSINTPNSDNTVLTFEVNYKDVTGNQGTTSVQFKTDMAIPFVDSISINGGVSPAKNNNLKVSFSAHDDTSKVSSFCLKYNDSSAPALNAPCWVNVNAPSPGISPAPIINVTDFYFQVGFVKAFYDVYIWVKDEAGYISTNTNTINVDKYTIEFDPGTPPRVLAIQVSNSDTPGNPITSTDLTVSGGNSVYIKWNVEDTEGLGALPIKIEYTTDDSTFSAMGADEYIANAVNAGCTIDAQFTGCTVIPAPVGSYFKLRVIAKDSEDTVVFANSPALNESGFSIIAGNTENGLKGSALSALYYMFGKNQNVSSLQKHTLAVSEDGKFFYLDPQRGLLWINPLTGVLDVFLKYTGTSSGDGGHVKDATASGVSAITLDAYNHLLIWDTTRLRRVNLTTMTITTILGGGGDYNPAGNVGAFDIALYGFDKFWYSLIPLPNGDIFFTSPQGVARKYKAATGQIERMNMVGIGYPFDGARDWGEIPHGDYGLVYDTTTATIQHMIKGFYHSWVGDSAISYGTIDPNSGNATTPYEGFGPHNFPGTHGNVYTGLDGKIYYVDRFRTVLRKYDHTNNTLTTILGTGGTASKPCAENTLATSCVVDIDSFFVAKSGQIYVMDGGVIRTIDASGNVITLFGQYGSYGDGGLASVARFGQIIDFKMGKHSAQNDKVIVMDAFSQSFREFTINSTINKIADVGIGWPGPWRFETDPATGDIFVPQGGPLYHLVRSTGNYVARITGSTYQYDNPDADGKDESLVYLNGYSNYTFGFVNGKVYLNKHYWVGYNYGCMDKSYDINDSFRQAHFSGHGVCSSVGPTVGEQLGPQYFGVYNVEEITDPADGLKKLLINAGNGNLYTQSPAGTLENFITGLPGISSFAIKIDGTGINVFYCASGRLHKYNKNSGNVDTLPWSSPSLSCSGARTLVYNAERNSLIFIFSQNGLSGIGEYKL